MQSGYYQLPAASLEGAFAPWLQLDAMGAKLEGKSKAAGTVLPVAAVHR